MRGILDCDLAIRRLASPAACLLERYSANEIWLSRGPECKRWRFTWKLRRATRSYIAVARMLPATSHSPPARMLQLLLSRVLGAFAAWHGLHAPSFTESPPIAAGRRLSASSSEAPKQQHCASPCRHVDLTDSHCRPPYELRSGNKISPCARDSAFRDAMPRSAPVSGVLRAQNLFSFPQVWQGCKAGTGGHAGAGRVTGHSGMGGSGWATAARYDTDSGMKFFVKQVPHDW